MSCSDGSKFGLKMLLEPSGAPGNAAGAVPVDGRPLGGALTAPPTGPPALYPLLVGRFWFSPLADCV